MFYVRGAWTRAVVKFKLCITPCNIPASLRVCLLLPASMLLFSLLALDAVFAVKPRLELIPASLLIVA